jgi:hypothetical protein
MNEELFHHLIDSDKLFIFGVIVLEVLDNIIADTASSAAHDLG